ncbi:heat shock 70 kDa 17 [Olea europaea subsp. europaea]|uniref:Heat shock 70 kDa 17 n=1 Tax=Olea europaea subsp. europaea TaxID=158383 RepID=A0A8S0S292_OLEEU|nr:heat shock 70 kDa 17 [Olea europaea subsp. europaea]
MVNPNTLFRFGIFLSLFMLNAVQSQSAVASIDLGSEWLEVTVVNLKQGQASILIAINEMSKRKTLSLVAFHANSRLIGEESLGLLARYPTKVHSHFSILLSKPFNYTQKFLQTLYLSYDITPDETRDIAVYRTEGEGGEFHNFTAEELVAMILKYAMGLAENHARSSVKDLVVDERRGLLTAVDLPGINVLALVNEHSGVALQYGIDKDFSNGSSHVMFHDMGASSTYAALVYFSAYNAKEFGKTTSVKDVRWDAELGGQNIELRLVEYFVDEFNKRLGNGVDIRNNVKAMAKLKKQVKRTKEILSANTMAPISVESLYDVCDFRSKISREKFEELCDDLWDKALVPVMEVLKHLGLKADDLYVVELIGGATRVPKLQAKLLELVGRKDLDKHLDVDEAIVLGASLHATNLTDGIKLNRKLGMIDGSTYRFVIDFTALQTFRSIIYNKDFEVSLAYESEDFMPPGASSLTFALYAVSSLTDSSEKSGVFSLDGVDVVVEITEWVEVPQKNVTTGNPTSASSNDTEAGLKSSSEESSDKLEINDSMSNASISSVTRSATSDIAIEKKLKKRTFRLPLKVIEKTAGPGMPLSKESFAEAKRKLEALDKKDAERRKTAELKNNLEEYIYSKKKEFEKISSDQEQQSFIGKLNEVQEWLYTDGEDASANEFLERLNTLKAIGDTIFYRYNELTVGPIASEHARRYLEEIIHGWEKDKSWLPRERIDEVKNWLNEKEAEQQKISGFSTPAFKSNEVYTKVFDLQDKVARINRISKPKPKVEKLVKTENESAADNSNDKDTFSRETMMRTP